MLLPASLSVAVVNKNKLFKKAYPQCSPLYMAMVRKWRYHFSGVLDRLFSRLDPAVSPPFDFAPLEGYMKGFVVRLHSIHDLPSDMLISKCSPDETEEGWYSIKGGAIHIFYDHTVTLSRQRFTIAHEWGHVFQKIDTEFKKDMEAVPDDAEREKIIESVANHFAAYYLVPDTHLDRELTRMNLFKTDTADYLPQLAQRFNLSPEAMCHRISNYRLPDKQ